MYYLFSSNIWAAIFAEFSAPFGTKFFENSFIKCMPKPDLNKIEQDFQSLQESLKHSDPKMFCKVHPTKYISFVCVNKTCPFTFFCQRCSKDHNKKCSKTNMFLNPDVIIKRENLDQIFDTKSFNYEDEINKVRKLVEETKKTIDYELNVMLLNAEDKLRSQSKEFKLKQFKKQAELKMKTWESNYSYRNLLDLANETFKYEVLNQMENLPNSNKVINDVEKILEAFKKNINDGVRKYKTSIKKSYEKEKQSIEDYWTKLLKQQFKNHNVDNLNSIDKTINTNFGKKKQPEEKKEVFEEIDEEPPANSDIRNAMNQIIPEKNTNNVNSQNNKKEDNEDSISGFPQCTIIIPSIKQGLEKYLKDAFTGEEKELICKDYIADSFKYVKLLYRFSSKNGFSASSFHEKTKDSCPTLTLFLTKEGRKFGAFNALPWGEDDKETNLNYIFSIDKKTIHFLKKNTSGDNIGTNKRDDAIDFNEEYGPIFGDGDLVIGNNCHAKETCTSNLGTVYNFAVENENPKLYLAGKEKFALKNMFVLLLSDKQNFKKV